MLYCPGGYCVECESSLADPLMKIETCVSPWRCEDLGGMCACISLDKRLSTQIGKRCIHPF
jgi:hypothetical protein